MPFLKKKNKRSVINAFCKFVVKQHRKQLDEYNDKKRKKPDRNGRQNAETHILGKHKSRFIRSKVIESNKCVI